jgi:hypothetical protein
MYRILRSLNRFVFDFRINYNTFILCGKCIVFYVIWINLRLISVITMIHCILCGKSIVFYVVWINLCLIPEITMIHCILCSKCIVFYVVWIDLCLISVITMIYCILHGKCIVFYVVWIDLCLLADDGGWALEYPRGYIVLCISSVQMFLL